MYNPWWKYQLKALLGRKNDTWHFDRMCKTYMRKNSLIQREKVYNNARLLLALENEQKDAREFIEKFPGFEVNPIYDQACLIRKQKIEAQARIHQNCPYTFHFHLPGADFSMGAHSWFSSLMSGMRHQGIGVSSFWHRLNQPRLDKEKISFIVTGYNQAYVEQINWEYLKTEKDRGVKCVVVFSIPLNHESIQLMKGIQSAYDTFCSVQFYTFHDQDFEPYDGFKADCQRHGFVIYHIPFAANPLFHYPSPVVSKELDYVFLGSANFDKINRYNIFFNKIIHHHVGLIDGPGWPWSSKFQYASSIDKYIYAQSKVALNLHIDEQIREPRELNERTYILEACGSAQVIDSPALIEKNLGISRGAKNEKIYFEVFNDVIQNGISENVRLRQYYLVYSSQTVFDRIDGFLNNIKINTYDL